MRSDPVDEQLAAYNEGDLDRFLACYDDEVLIEDAGGAVVMRGRDAMRRVYGALFADNPDLHAEVRARIRVGAFVVDDEFVTGVRSAGSAGTMRLVVIYRLFEGRIVHVRLLR